MTGNWWPAEISLSPDRADRLPRGTPDLALLQNQLADCRMEVDPISQREIDAAVNDAMAGALMSAGILPEWTRFRSVPPPVQDAPARSDGTEAEDEWNSVATDYISECSCFKNSRYIILIHDVPARAGCPALWHMLISRLDGERPGPERYSDFMHIRDELFGDEVEAAEIYPARSRETDRANVYHLWVASSPARTFLGPGTRARNVRKQSSPEKARADGSVEPWTPFRSVEDHPPGEEWIQRRMASTGISREDAIADEEYLSESLHFQNSTYSAWIHNFDARALPLWHLRIKRLDGRRPGRERYPDFMRIRDELIGPENEGMEIYPARSREMDLANCYHIWVVRKPSDHFPFGLIPTKGLAPNPQSASCSAATTRKSN